MSGGVSKANWLTYLNSILASATNSNSSVISIPGNFTELVTDNTTLRFTVTTAVG